MDATLADPILGRYLDGRYRIDDLVARGGMAAVYRAVDTRLDRTVAVKVMHPVLADDEDFVVRFRREAKAAARLSHPEVVAVFDQGEDAGQVFLVMEYVAGATLRALLGRRGRLTPGQAVTVLLPLLRALGAAHRAGVVHRDVKPENVLLADDGRVKVADFGLAWAVAASNLTTTTGLLIGTVAYLAPEQVQAGRADPRSDVYAAGIMAWEMLTGSIPYAGGTPLAIAYRHVHDDVPPPSTVVPGVPAALDDLVLRATRRDPAARPADANALLADLHAILATGQIAPPTESPAAVFAAGTDESPRPAASQTGRQDTLVVPDVPAARPAPPTGVAPVPALVPVAAPAPAPAMLPAAPVPVPPPRRRRRSWLPAVVVAIAALAAVAGGWYLGAGRYTTAPSVLGRDRGAAEQIATRASLHLRYGEPAFTETAAVDTVVTQSPAPRGRVLRNGTVTVALSKGPERYAVPALTGRTRAEANRALADQHLRTGAVSDRFDDTAPTGAVVETDPPVGTRVTRDTAVALVLSKGVEPVAVPDVRGQSAADAAAILTKARLEAATSEAYDDNVSAGSVVSQDPAPGATVGKGSAVALVVSKGPQLFAVPDVTGKTRDRAVNELTASGFRTRVVALPVGPGTVRSQDPGGAAQARRGTVVTLFVF